MSNRRNRPRHREITVSESSRLIRRRQGFVVFPRTPAVINPFAYVTAVRGLPPKPWPKNDAYDSSRYPIIRSFRLDLCR